MKYTEWIKKYPGFFIFTVLTPPILLLLAVVPLVALLSRHGFTQWADDNPWFTAMGLPITLIGLLASIAFGLYAIRENRRFTKHFSEADAASQNQLNRLHGIAEEIADSTRHPLFGIEDVLYRIYRMLLGHQEAVNAQERISQHVRKECEILFLGFTLGLGYAHQVTSVREEWKKYLRERRRQVEEFDEFVGKLKDEFEICITKTKQNVRCYCLDHGATQGDCATSDIERRFLAPLYETRYNNKYNGDTRTTNTSMLWQHHGDLKKHIEERGGVVKTTETLPLQILIATVKKHNGEVGDAVMVFNIGALNAGTEEVAGFYSESADMCKMFRVYITSLET